MISSKPVVDINVDPLDEARRRRRALLRSAAAQGDKADARKWLRRAASLAAGQPVRRAAADLLRSLDQAGN
jgi:hypothetical protein